MRSKTSNEAKLARRKPKNMEHLCPEAIHQPRHKERKENVSDQYYIYYIFALTSAKRDSLEKIIN